MKFVVTGGRGFIGSHFVEKVLSAGHTVIDIDKMTYASINVLPWDNHKNYTLIKEDISTIEHLPSCDVLVNFAAESHVDNSINSSDIFLQSNVYGVHNLLELVRGKQPHDRPLFFQISTLFPIFVFYCYSPITEQESLYHNHTCLGAEIHQHK